MKKIQINCNKDFNDLISKKTLKFIYKNHKGDTALRTVKPVSIRFGNTQWHTKEQWLLKAYDFDRSAYREFALTNIISWEK